jgi:carbamoyl-phosphate synthase large subunit
MWRGKTSGVARILVTGAGGNIGQGVLKSLSACGLASWVVATDANPLSLGLFEVDRSYAVPKASAPGFLDAFVDILCVERIQLVFVCADTEILPVSRLRERIEAASGARVLVSAPDVVARCADKWLTAQWFARVGLPHPRTALADDAAGIADIVTSCGFPVVVKPRLGYASRGLTIAGNRAALAAAAAVLGREGVVQEHLSDSSCEHTAATFSSRPGAAEACIVMRRELLQGTSYRVEPVFDPALEAEALRWGRTMGGLGPLNFQFRVTSSGPVCFEVNPRFSGTVGVRFRFGYNDVELAVRAFLLGEAPAQPRLRPGMVLRYWEEVFIEPERVPLDRGTPGGASGVLVHG